MESRGTGHTTEEGQICTIVEGVQQGVHKNFIIVSIHLVNSMG